MRNTTVADVSYSSYYRTRALEYVISLGVLVLALTCIVPVLQSTWAGDAHGAIAYYSEVEDPHYSTTNLGVPNSEQGITTVSPRTPSVSFYGDSHGTVGHCMKTMAIIDRFHSEQIRDGKQWLVITDDDTLLRQVISTT